MAAPRPLTITCPECSTSQEVRVWASVNVTLYPHLKQEVIERRINTIECTSCKEKLFEDLPLLYHDTPKCLAIQYLPRSTVESADYFRGLGKDGSNLPSTGQPYSMPEHLRKPIYVFSISGLSIYVQFMDACERFGQ